MASPSSPASPSTFEQKYDRSTRLWGADGQKLLAEAHILLLGASSTGCEILKNIILPGVGRFTIVDDAAVTKQDLGRNFFVRPDSIGKNIAEETRAVLSELNNFSESHFFAQSVKDFVNQGGHGFLHGHVADELRHSADPIQGRPAAFKRPSWKATHIIVAGNRTPLETLQKLANTNSSDVPIFYVGSNGLLGYMRILSGDVPVVDTVPGPDDKVFDPRVIHTFPALKEIYESLNPWSKEMDKDTYFHLPWPAVVYHALKTWRERNGKAADDKSMPNMSSFAEVKQLKEIITEMSKLHPNPDPTKAGVPPEGFDEAKVNLNSCFNFGKIPSELAEVLDMAPARAAQGKNVLPFWIYLNAIREFREENGFLPLQPALPDFTATTQIYLTLSRTFRKYFQEVEVESVVARARAYLKKQYNMTDDEINQKISTEDAAKFCTNIRFVQYQEYSTLEAEVGTDFAKPFTFIPNSANNNKAIFALKAKSNEGEASSTDRACGWYAAMRAAMLFAFKNQQHRLPGQVFSEIDVSNSIDADESATIELATQLWGDAKLAADGASTGNTSGGLPEDVAKQVKEIVRYGGAELGQIAAIVGAVASQEVIKFIQSKRVPATPWVFFDGNASKFIQVEQQ